MTEKQKQALLNRGVKAFQRMLKDKNIISIERNGEKCVIYYKDNSIFTCSGAIVENSVIAYNKISEEATQ